MPIFSPRRYQAPFYPVCRDAAPMRAFTAFERSVKGALFGCRMCGNCILQETAFVCPMTCAMGLRNGLCGGASPDHCCVDATRPCTWFMIYERAERLGMTDKLLEINAPLDGNRVGHETWIDMLQKWRNWDNGPRPIELIHRPGEVQRGFGQLLLRSAPAGLVARRRRISSPGLHGAHLGLEAALRTGEFTVTGEIAPPLGASTKILDTQGGLLSRATWPRPTSPTTPRPRPA